MLGVVRFHVFGKGRQHGVLGFIKASEQGFGAFTRIRAAGNIGRAGLVMSQQLGAVRQIERAVPGEFDLGLLGGDLGVHFGVALAVMFLLGLAPVRLVAMRDAQGGESALKDNL
jgi:hypothetical protein